MNNQYWQSISSRRVSRRRTLIAASSASAAAFLAACGGGSKSTNSSGANKDSSSLLTQPVDTLKTAKRGGVLKDRTYSDTPSFEPSAANSPWNSAAPHVYSSLVQTKPGHLKPSESEIAPDLVESWETSPDGLQITMKLRQGVKWQNMAPINGRALDVDDVVFTWNRFIAKAPGRSSVANSVDPSAPVLSLTASDSKTIVIKLKEPLVIALALFASNSSGNIVVVPKETDGALQINHAMVGTGPYTLASYTPSVGYSFKRNPDYWDKDYALVDQIDVPIVPEYATALAQFKTGNIYTFGAYASGPKINQEDVLTTKKDVPDIAIYPGDLGNPQGLGTRVLVFGQLPAGKSPFLDERVRQAISKSWDRDLFQDTFFNISKFAAAGLPVESRWNSSIIATYEGWWLDPKSKDFGPNAQYYQHDLSEAKKLLSAAGYPNGFTTKSNYVTGPELVTAPFAEPIDGFIKELGINAPVNGLNYANDYIPNYRDGQGQYEGWLYRSTAGGIGAATPEGSISNDYWAKSGSTFHGFSTNGKNDRSGDPQVNAMIEKMRVEPDTAKRKSIVFDLQRYLAKAMFSIYPPGVGAGFLVAWPCVGNFHVYQGGRLNYQLWVDDSKPPLSKKA